MNTIQKQIRKGVNETRHLMSIFQTSHVLHKSCLCVLIFTDNRQIMTTYASMKGDNILISQINWLVIVVHKPFTWTHMRTESNGNRDSSNNVSTILIIKEYWKVYVNFKQEEISATYVNDADKRYWNIYANMISLINWVISI